MGWFDDLFSPGNRAAPHAGAASTDSGRSGLVGGRARRIFEILAVVTFAGLSISMAGKAEDMNMAFAQKAEKYAVTIEAINRFCDAQKYDAAYAELPGDAIDAALFWRATREYPAPLPGKLGSDAYPLPKLECSIDELAMLASPETILSKTEQILATSKTIKGAIKGEDTADSMPDYLPEYFDQDLIPTVPGWKEINQDSDMLSRRRSFYELISVKDVDFIKGFILVFMHEDGRLERVENQNFINRALLPYPEPKDNWQRAWNEFLPELCLRDGSPEGWGPVGCTYSE